MKALLLVVDMQNDFVTGVLGTKEAESIVNAAAKKAREYPGHVFFSMDTHTEDYLSTQEGKLLPIKHCVAGTKGWQLVQELAKVQAERNGAVYYKSTFASQRLAEDLREIHKEQPIKEIELIGLCTDVCVVSNALLLKAYMQKCRFMWMHPAVRELHRINTGRHYRRWRAAISCKDNIGDLNDVMKHIEI